MFNKSDFEVFEIPDLAGRLAAVRKTLDPKFDEIAPRIIEILSNEKETYAHVAMHRRRHKNPPTNTWVAFSESKRGYKMMPHVELGFWDDRLFLWLAGLTELKDRKKFVTDLKDNDSLSSHVDSADWQLCGDHTKKNIVPLTNDNYVRLLQRYNQTTKAEFLVGRVWLKDNPIFKDPVALNDSIIQVTRGIAPLYQILNK
ncbi:hypothetical protein C5L31_000461 [Secundilactobacillus malefermentans]|uniref:Uncharacterized protein n=1 Tax=Secundilactobacillus malefermentans TaxID=176292 RepID=A0A4R5NH07_9LACO|nr:DUF1054 family protein [Secundilactobacillus malefermentans]TDG73214.1 hypothetical protein C5L31_000461 [Secundilactobacillus malefermentans]